MPAAEPSLPRFHLTARPWAESEVRADALYDAVEGGCRFLAGLQDARGAIVDPLLHREHQYGTPYFAASVAILAAAGRAPDLLEAGCRAMDHATEAFAGGAATIPDRHGEFFLASLPEALEAFEEAAKAGRGPAPERLALWRGRLTVPAGDIVNPVNVNNWRAYAMKGEWLRALLGLAGRDAATAFVEAAWNDTQRARIADEPGSLYRDRGTDPDSLAVEAVGRDNLLALAAAGYSDSGPSGPAIAAAAERGTRTALLLQDPSGQCPPGGRASDHVFNDALYVLGFAVLAEREAARGAPDDLEAAGRDRRAAALAFRSLARWRRDGAAAGSWFVTKNRFDPAQRVGYQAASNVANYNAATILHLAEAARAWKSAVPERPAPAEVGGYAFATGPGFAAVAANAGGMQLLAFLRGDAKTVYGRYWTALGVDRFARAGWETRLGPSDGIRDPASGRGITFAPAWTEDGKWVRLADLPDRYAGRFHAEFVHPLLVHCGIDYAPLSGGGPRFHHDFVITPDGVLATLRAEVPAGTRWGTTWPLLADDGTPLEIATGPGLATTGYPGGTDREAFLDADSAAPAPEAGEALQSAYGWLRPFLAEAQGGAQRTFVYPQGAGDPAPDAVRRSLRVADGGFASVLGRVEGNLYMGRTAAGGEGSAIDWDGDGKPDATFSAPCRFVIRLDAGKAVAVEADRPVRAAIGGRTLDLAAYAPVTLAP